MTEHKRREGVQRFLVGLEDGSEWTVVTKHKDLLAWEDYAAPKKWTVEARGIRFGLYITWSASRRDGMIPKAMTLDQWNDAVDYVDKADDPEEDEAAPFPGGELPPEADRDSGGDRIDPAGMA